MKECAAQQSYVPRPKSLCELGHRKNEGVGEKQLFGVFETTQNKLLIWSPVKSLTSHSLPPFRLEVF